MRDYISRLIWKRTQGARAETDMAYHSAGSPFEFEEARLNSRPLCSDGEAVLRQPFGVSEGH